jgi:hypothetical protein
VELETSSPAVGLAAGLAVWPAARKGQQPGQQPEIRLPVFWPVAVGRLFFRLPVGGWLPAQTARQSNSRPLTNRGAHTVRILNSALQARRQIRSQARMLILAWGGVRLDPG